MAGFKITFISPKGVEKVVECAADKYILEAAEEAGMELPYSCRAGRCSTCTGKLVEGKVNNSEQAYLDEDQVKQGFVLLCVAYPVSDCRFFTHQQENL